MYAYAVRLWHSKFIPISTLNVEIYRLYIRRDADKTYPNLPCCGAQLFTLPRTYARIPTFIPTELHVERTDRPSSVIQQSNYFHYVQFFVCFKMENYICIAPTRVAAVGHRRIGNLYDADLHFHSFTATEPLSADGLSHRLVALSERSWSGSRSSRLLLLVGCYQGLLLRSVGDSFQKYGYLAYGQYECSSSRNRN